MASDEELRKKAEKIAREKIGFYIHFGIYLVVNAMTVVTWWAYGGGFPWFIFMTVGWGIGIVAHFVQTFYALGKVDSMAQKEYEKLKSQKR